MPSALRGFRFKIPHSAIRRANFFMDDTIVQISRPASWTLLTRGHAKKIDPYIDPYIDRF
jgi:hypothetical protein